MAVLPRTYLCWFVWYISTCLCWKITTLFSNINFIKIKIIRIQTRKMYGSINKNVLVLIYIIYNHMSVLGINHTLQQSYFYNDEDILGSSWGKCMAVLPRTYLCLFVWYISTCLCLEITRLYGKINSITMKIF
jgi:hypothetical protein